MKNTVILMIGLVFPLKKLLTNKVTVFNNPNNFVLNVYHFIGVAGSE